MQKVGNGAKRQRIERETYLLFPFEKETMVPELACSCFRTTANVKSGVSFILSTARWKTMVGRTRFRSPPVGNGREKQSEMDLKAKVRCDKFYGLKGQNYHCISIDQAMGQREQQKRWLRSTCDCSELLLPVEWIIITCMPHSIREFQFHQVQICNGCLTPVLSGVGNWLQKHSFQFNIYQSANETPFLTPLADFRYLLKCIQ